MMNRVFPPLAVLCLLACDGGSTPRAPTGSWPSADASLEEQVLDLVNERRAQGATCGGQSFGPAPALDMEPALQEAARGHSYDMVVRDFFSHTNESGESPGDRIDALGYEWSGWGENIAAGQTTAESVMQSWMSSPGHCRNIMNPDFEEIGVGFHMNHWTQVFGTPR